MDLEEAKKLLKEIKEILKDNEASNDYKILRITDDFVDLNVRLWSIGHYDYDKLNDDEKKAAKKWRNGDYVSEAELKIKEAFDEMLKQKDISVYEESSLIGTAKHLAEITGIDVRELVYDAFPQNYKVILDKEWNEARKTIYETVLNSDKLDLYQLHTCLQLNAGFVKNMLKNDNALLAKVEQMFGNPKDFYITEELYKSGNLNDIFDMKQKFEQTQDKLQELSGKEVFEVLRKNLDDIPQYNHARLLNSAFSILNEYDQQTRDLSARSQRETDLFYTGYKNKPSGKHLALIGQFADYPEIEAIMEEKIGKMYSYFSYPTPVYDKDAKERYHQVDHFSYVCHDGGDKFAENMMEELLKDATSTKSAFYIKYAVDVLTQHECGYRYGCLMTKVIPQIIDKHPDVCETLAAGMKRDKTFLEIGCAGSNNIKKELVNNPESAASQLYLAHIQDFFKEDSYAYIEILPEILKANKANHPEICEQLNEHLLKMYQNVTDTRTINSCLSYFSDIYEIYPTEKMKEFLSDCAEKITGNGYDLTVYAKAKEQTGVEAFDKLMDKVIAENKDGIILKNLKQGIEYTELFEKIAKSGVKSIRLRQDRFADEYTLDCAETAKITSLEYLDTDRESDNDKLKFENAQELLKLPNLKELNIKLSDEQSHEFYKTLLKEKPHNLHKLSWQIKFTDKERETLMTKYHDLIVGSSWDSLERRNETVIKALDGKYSLSEIADEGVLAEYLSVLPKAKRPSFNKLAKEDKKTGKSVLDILREQAEGYFGQLEKIADILEDKEIKDMLKLRKLVTEGKLMEFLQTAKKEDLPKLKTLYSANPAFNNETIFDLVDTEENKAKILKIMNVDEKDIAVLSKVESMGEAVAQWQAQQKMNQGKAATQAAFEKWKASQGIKK